MNRATCSRATALLVSLTLLGGQVAAWAQSPKLSAPNVVEVSSRLVTSGQPAAEALAGLRAEGFEAVIYLAPPQVRDAVRDEQLIVARQGLVFINIPISFDNPTQADFETFAALLAGLGDRKVLVHCQVNFRASTMVFLYRAIKLKEQPQAAYADLQKVWSPNGPWRKLIESQLRGNNISFELL
jgi:protein tyrosine phosphatase (PTP) superfamily phosphohydrolase (DUF442 family)